MYTVRSNGNEMRDLSRQFSPPESTETFDTGLNGEIIECRQVGRGQAESSEDESVVGGIESRGE